VILGIGDEGIFACVSGMPGLATALDLSNTTTVVEGVAPVEPQGPAQPDTATLLRTDLLVLHVTGEPKLATLQRAACGGSALEMPVRALLTQDRVSLQIYHAP